jgi:hypothetical protein
VPYSEASMAFEKSKDKVLRTVGRIESGGLPINLVIHSYDGGEPKLGLQRQLAVEKGGETKVYPKSLGRMNEEEVVALIKALGFKTEEDEDKVRSVFTKAKKVARKRNLKKVARKRKIVEEDEAAQKKSKKKTRSK